MDLERAYDHVNWSCLLNVLQLNFGRKWIRWINTCISTARFFILINVSPKGFFNSQRGHRQGDPLSPYSVIIVMEILSLIFKRAESLGWIKGFKIEVACFGWDVLVMRVSKLQTKHRINFIHE